MRSYRRRLAVALTWIGAAVTAAAATVEVRHGGRLLGSAATDRHATA